MKNIVIGLFDDGSRAQTVAQELIQAGFDRGDICLASSESELRDTIADTNLSRDETEYYIGEISRGAAVVTAVAGPDRAERAVQIMRTHKARAAGLPGAEGERQMRAEREMAFPVIEEELRVGKRMVERGGVRIYNRVTERPVEQQVNLREERIKVEHRRVDRMASEQDMSMFREGREVDLTEMSEEAVIAKEPHVVEEVIVSKEIVDHPETIRDTVRRTDVEVERLAGAEGKRAPAQPLEGTAPAMTGQAQAARAVIPNDLQRLKDLEGFEIAEGDIDPRGWDLIGRDGDKIGKIDGLLASPSARKAYFAVVNTGGWLQNKLFAIPLANISFDLNQKKARAPYLKKQFHGAPEYRESDRDYHRYHDYWTGLGGEFTSAAGSGRR
ncbi:MAG TPA: DUF2382 domain-containing protein [Blastocatellia bacterium]|nr:DUF2382 domain-containing protein [Blastocatellia bacterium]